MNEIIKLLEDGGFKQGRYTITLPSGVDIWTANGAFGLSFYPEAGSGFSFLEKRKLMKAIKKGRIKQALLEKKVL